MKNTFKLHQLLVLATSLCLPLCAAFDARAQVSSGGGYVVTQMVVAGGGASSTGGSTAGSIELTGTIGQHDAATSRAGVFTLEGGFWPEAGVAAPPPPVSAAVWTLVNESCPQSNGAIDPGERLTVNLQLSNNGNSPISNLVAVLQSSGGIVAPSGPQNYGSIAQGGLAARDFSFTATGTCGGNLAATLHLYDGTTDLGTVTYNLPLGVNNGNGFVCTSPCGGVGLVVTSTTIRIDASVVGAVITIQNIGSVAANSVILNTVKLGTANTSTPMPLAIGNGTLNPGDSASVTVNLTNSTPGAASTLTVAGSYAGGSFSSTRRLTVP